MNKAGLLLFLFAVPIDAQTYYVGPALGPHSVSCGTDSFINPNDGASATYECCVTAAAELSLPPKDNAVCPTDGTSTGGKARPVIVSL